MRACGAIGIIKESTEARRVKDFVIWQLRNYGHTVYDCTVGNGTGSTDVLKKIVAKCNANKVDLDVSIHFNAGSKDLFGNARTTGTEVLIYNSKSTAKKYAQSVCNSIAKLGFTNRGVKCRSGLYYLRKVNAPAMLIECCFVDDMDDVLMYRAEAMASAITQGITGMSAPVKAVVQKTGYELVFDANYYAGKYPDLRKAYGNDATKLLNHFKKYGMDEGRQAISTFNPVSYKSNYPDLQRAFGTGWKKYYEHYMNYGAKEGRSGV